MGSQAGAWGPQARAVKTLWVLGGSEAQTHVGTEEPNRPSHEGLGGTRRDEARRQLPRTAGVQSKSPWDGSESERGRSGAAGTLGVTHGDRD